MHNCKTGHPGKSHRRRNRGLRCALEPLHWWVHPLAAVRGWGTGVRRRAVTLWPTMPTAHLATAGSVASFTQASDRRVEVFQPSAIRRWAANLRRFVPFTRKTSA